MTRPCWIRLATDAKCLESATQQAAAGCVHEHIITGYVCDDHAVELLDQQINCVSCYESPGRHVCPLLGRVKPLELASTP